MVGPPPGPLAQGKSVFERSILLSIVPYRGMQLCYNCMLSVAAPAPLGSGAQAEAVLPHQDHMPAVAAGLG